jgi:arylsulfatase A-like enzyme
MHSIPFESGSTGVGWRPWCAAIGAALTLAGCGGPVQETVWYDLVEQYSMAEVRSETALIDIGTVEGRRHLGSGWSGDEIRRDGATFVWGMGERSEVTFFVTQPRDLLATIRCHPFQFPDAPTQRVAVAVNGRHVAQVELRRGLRTYSFEIPARAVVGGDNALTLAYAYHRRVSEVMASRDHRSLAVAWDLIRLEGTAAAAEPRVEDETGLLSVPFGCEVAYYLEVPPGEHIGVLELAEVRSGGGLLEVWWATDGTRPLRLASLREAHDPQRVSLPADGAGAARLALRAVPPAEVGLGGVTLTRPVVWGPSPPTPKRADDGPVIAKPLDRDQQRPPNVVVYLIDTLRSDRLGCYGHSVPVSPNIDALASEGVLFERVVAQSSWTKPAVVTILTGIGPLGHGVNRRDDRVPEGLDTLAEILRNSGYETAAFANNAYITEAAGFAQGFDHFDFAHSRSGDALGRVLDWLADRPLTAPFFLYVHTIDPHAPYEPSQPYRDRFAGSVTDRDVGSFDHIHALSRRELPITEALVEDMLRLYDAEVAENDHSFGVLMEALKSLGVYDDTLIVFLSDHGEGFQDHGVFGHGWDLYREVVEVPMIIRPPGWSDPVRVGEMVQQIDVVPTVLAAAGMPIAEHLEGIDLGPLMSRAGARAEPRPAATYMHYKVREGISVSYRGWKLIEPLSAGFTAGRELYRHADDPGELHDLAGAHPIQAGLLAGFARAALREREIGFRPEQLAAFEGDTRRALEALGYIR